MVTGFVGPVPGPAEVERLLRPQPPLEADVMAFLREQLGAVLPSAEGRGIRRYYEQVVLGRRAREALAVLVRERPTSAGPVVDVGSGLGSFVLLSNLLGVPAVGVEPGGAELALARRRAAELGLDGETFRHGSGERLPLGDGEASAVLVQDVLEHVRGWRGLLAEAWRVLAPGGALYVKGPSYAARFFEPHYRLPWLPLLPRPAAHAYLRLLRRDVAYFEGIVYVRRGATLAHLRALGFRLSFPRVDKMADPDSINRPWARRLVRALGRTVHLGVLARLIAENPVQGTIDVVGRKPAP